MVDRVRTALQNSRVDDVYAVLSPHAPATTSYLAGDIPCIKTPGNGYVSDLQTALAEGAVEPPVLTSVADLPLLASGTVNRLIAHARGESLDGTGNGNVNEIGNVDGNETGDGPPKGDGRVRSTTAVVPAALKRELGASIDSDGPWIPAGLNVVAETDTERETTDDDATDGEETASSAGLFRSWDARLAVNVNHRRDVRVANRLCLVEER